MSTSQVQEARRLVGLELNALRLVDALPAATFEGARVGAAGTPVHDLDGELSSIGSRCRSAEARRAMPTSPPTPRSARR